MTRFWKLLLLAFLIPMFMGMSANLWAQQKVAGKTEKNGGTSEVGKNILLPTVYLGHSDYKGGPISKADFDKWLKQGLTSNDALGNKYKVKSFDFNYVERELFEDSIGNLKIMSEVYYEYCVGDTVTSAISASIYDRTKPGDTVYIDKVSVARYLSKNMKTVDTLVIGAKGLKCVIVK